MEKSYVSPEYKQRLDDLAHTLITARRFGQTALEDTVELSPVQDTLFDADNIVRGVE